MALHGQEAVDIEEQIRRMVLNGSVPNETASTSTRPAMRLPPGSSNTANHSHLTSAAPAPAPAPAPATYQQHSYLLHTPNSASSSHSPRYPPPPMMHAPPIQSPSTYAPHLRNPSYGRQYGPQQGPPGPRGPLPRQQHQQIQLDPSAFQRRSAHNNNRPPPGQRTLFDPNAQQAPPTYSHNHVHDRKAQYLEQIAGTEIANVDMTQAERDDKEAFRRSLQQICEEVCQEDANLPSVSLECFGSFQSGFASAGSDMDLVIVVQNQAATASSFSLLEDDLPRALERKLLRSGYGARLLTRTRVPIIKVCQSPGESFLDKLREEREKWDFLPNEQKYPHLFQREEEAEDDMPQAAEPADAAGQLRTSAEPASRQKTVDTAKIIVTSNAIEVTTQSTTTTTNVPQSPAAKREQTKSTWTRERKAGPLDFPKDGVGIQCDINFFNPLGLHNTQMLRCYSLCDARVRPMVLFVKSWAKQRKINSSYSGTLSSYGYVMMVLHYLMNVVQPPVLPNLQLPWRPSSRCTPPGAEKAEVDGWVIDFWRNEDEIKAAVQNGQMSANRESLGSLLAGFFQYYSSQGRGPQFRWTQWVLSLRSPGGIMTKDAKGWVKATTEEGEGKKIQNRYLFCIEDPFELSHNVARTVTHNGIVAIRDEFRRAYRILLAIGEGTQPDDGDLFAPLVEAEEIIEATEKLRLGDGAQNTPLQFGFDQHMNRKQAKPQSNPRNGNNKQSVGPMFNHKPKKIDVADQEAFPTLGAAAAKPKQRRKKSDTNAASISGDKAQAYLQEFRRKKAEEQAEHTAMGAAESVLSGND